MYLLLDRREQAIDTIEQGVKMDHSQDIERLLEILGVYHQTVFPFEKRRNLMKVTSGRFLSKIVLHEESRNLRNHFNSIRNAGMRNCIKLMR